MDNLLEFWRVSDAVNLSRSTIYCLIKANKFPQPIKDKRSARWLESEINAWVQVNGVKSKQPAIRESKTCVVCGEAFFRKCTGNIQWMKQTCCSQKCRDNREHIDLKEQFWSKVDKSGPDECWNFRSLNGVGYGQLNVKKIKKTPSAAHRISYEMHYGPIPKGLVVRHKCDNKACVNPNHLEIGTQKDNVRDTVTRGRLSKKSFINLELGRELLRERHKRP